MNNKSVKILLGSLIIVLLGFAGLKIYDYFTGIERLENSKVRKVISDSNVDIMI